MAEIGEKSRGEGRRRRLLRRSTWAVVAIAITLVIVLLGVSQPDRQSVERTTPSPASGAHAAPSATAEAAPTPAATQRRLGLHVTEAELRAWRERAANGPYRVEGDVRAHSPGDWDRITENATLFMNDPRASLWQGPVRNTPDGCVRKVNDAADNPKFVPPWPKADNLRDAAFVALVNRSDEHAAAVRDVLLEQLTIDGVDFGNRDRYCMGAIVGDENPIFNIANWLTRLQFAYDYLGIYDPDLFSDQERQAIREWFASAAEWMQFAVDTKLDELFVDRDGGDYRLTDIAQDGWSRRLYDGGPKAFTLQRRYNNRAATAVRFITLVGVAQENERFIATGEAYVKEFLKFGYYPEGVVGEFERWKRNDPTRGWKYATEQLGSIITIADTLARAGNDTLYRFETTEGALGTEGPHHSGDKKSLRTLTNDLFAYVDGSYQRKTPRGGDILPSEDGWIHDIMLVMANRYYRDPHIRSLYTREGSLTYPENPRLSQGHPASGEWGVYPGILFMFGQLEDGPTPYCLSRQPIAVTQLSQAGSCS